MKITEFSYLANSFLKTDSQVRPALSAAYRCVLSHLAAYRERQSPQQTLKRKWVSLGFPHHILNNHAECAQFLVATGINLQMAAYQEQEIPSDVDGHPMIRVRGKLERWEDVKRLLLKSPETEEVCSREAPRETWRYLPREGLVPCDQYRRLLPIAFITPDEVGRVFACAQRFYNTNEEIDVGESKDWVLQLYISPYVRKGVLKHPIFDNLMDNISRHISLRLVNREGQVYSFGVSMEKRTREFIFGNLRMTRLLAKGTGRISKVGDYQEFRIPAGERHVTNIPLTANRAGQIIEMVNEVNRLPFQFLSNNCYRLASFVVELAGYSLHEETTVRQVFLSSLPSLKAIPLVGKVLEYIRKHMVVTAYQQIPPPVQSVIHYFSLAPLIPLTALFDLFTKALLARLGQYRRVPLRYRDWTWYSSLSNRVSAVVKTLSRPTAICFPIHFNRWQRAQHSTFVATYPDRRPRLAIAPSTLFL